MSQNNSNNRGNNPRRRRPNSGTRKSNPSGQGQGQGQDQRSAGPRQPGKVPVSNKPGTTPPAAAPGALQKFLNVISLGFLGKKAAPAPAAPPARVASASSRYEDRSSRSYEGKSPDRTGDRSRDNFRSSESRDRNDERPSQSESRPPREAREPRPVREPRESRPAPTMEPPTSERLYVGNLSYDATEQDLAELFKGVGSVRSAEVVINNRTQRSKGYAFVTMSTADEARRAFEVLHNQPFMGRQLVVGGAKASVPHQDQDQDQNQDAAESKSEANIEPESVA